jgi:hypothetical protein
MVAAAAAAAAAAQADSASRLDLALNYRTEDTVHKDQASVALVVVPAVVLVPAVVGLAPAAGWEADPVAAREEDRPSRLPIDSGSEESHLPVAGGLDRCPADRVAYNQAVA